MKARHAAAPAALGIGVAALLVAGCVDSNMPLLTNVMMAPGACNGPGGGWAGCSLYDEVSFTFYNAIPSTATAAYTGTKMPMGAGGGDRPFEIDGTHYISVVLTGAVAHDLRGKGTAQGAVYAQGMHKIAETAMLEDYEGYVRYVIGLNSSSTPSVRTWRSGKTFTVVVG
jgi:hypothetical protein